MKKAILFKNLENNKVQCAVCSQRCVIEQGKLGFCGVRENIDGKLYSLVYGKVAAKNIDPIEKKPLFHFMPGSMAYSFSTVGCNMRCLYCQNYSISQIGKEKLEVFGEDMTPEQIVEQAIQNNCQSIAYTYTEPTVYLEFALDTMKIAKKKGLKNIWVSNGYMTEEALKKVKSYLDAINVDLKFFDNEKYVKNCAAKLEPVLNNLKWLHKNKIWLEITTLIIPGQNDDEKQLKGIAEFIKNELADTVPWHVSAFYPTFKMLDTPPTPVETIKKAYEIGKSAGLKYVYAGNVAEDGLENTYCINCGNLLIKRTGYNIERLDDKGKCRKCDRKTDIQD